MPKKTANLKKQISKFEKIVLQNVKTNILLGSAEWFSCRSAALCKQRWIDPVFAECASPLKTPHEICSVNRDAGISLLDVVDYFQKRGRRPEALEKIAGQPVLHFFPEGVYIWSPKPREKFLLSIWLTFPSYPAGW